MIHPRRLLTVSLVCLGLMLLVGWCACGQELRVGGRGDIGIGAVPPAGVLPCDPQCADRGQSATPPDAGVAACYQTYAREWLRGAVTRGELLSYLPPAQALSLLYPVAVVWGACPVWVTGTTTGGATVTTCCAGVAYPTWIRVSLGEPARVLPLVAWETANSYVCYWLGLWTLADGWPASRATAYARSACGS